MKTSINTPRYGFMALFVSLLAMLIVYPFLESLFVTKIFMRVFFTTTLLLAIYLISNRKWIFYLGLLLIVPSITFSWVSYASPTLSFELLSDSFSFAFILLIIVVIASSILKADKVTKDLVFGTLCIYLFLGVLWADAYAIIEAIIPHSFSSTLHLPIDQFMQREPEDFMYYSFVTLTTLGYGDIAPLSLPAKYFSIIEALTGQLFIATAIAKTVATYIRRKKA